MRLSVIHQLTAGTHNIVDLSNDPMNKYLENVANNVRPDLIIVPLTILTYKTLMSLRRDLLLIYRIWTSTNDSRKGFLEFWSPSPSSFLLHVSHRLLQKSVWYDIFSSHSEKTRDLSPSPRCSPCLPAACVSRAEEQGRCSTHTRTHTRQCGTHTNTSS